MKTLHHVYRRTLNMKNRLTQVLGRTYDTYCASLFQSVWWH